MVGWVVPFLPLVLLLAWQALGRSASFALGWATALYFGEVPGSQGRILSVISLLSVGWVIVLVGFGLPIGIGAALESTRAIGRNFDVQPLHALGLAAAILLTPPVVAAGAVVGKFRGDRTIGRWLRLVPVSYPATLMLGVSVLEMVVFTPYLLVQRLRHRREVVQIPLVMRSGTTDEDLVAAVRAAIASIGIGEVETHQAEGITSWPMKSLGFAAHHLLGSVVRGKPMELRVDGVEVYAYATNVSVLGPSELAFRIRAAVERELALGDAYLTWSEEAKRFEDELRRAVESSNGDVAGLQQRLDEVQGRIDATSLDGEEWHVLSRLRLEAEHAAAEASVA